MNMLNMVWQGSFIVNLNRFISDTLIKKTNTKNQLNTLLNSSTILQQIINNLLSVREDRFIPGSHRPHIRHK